MEIKKIYFDMDGVLADFDRGVIELCGLAPLDQMNRLPEQDDELYVQMRKIDHFYDKLKVMPGAAEMFQTVYAKYADKCEILSGIPKPKRGIVTAGEDKIKWMKRELSENIVCNIVYREQKKDYCTGKDCILIDDLEKNISEWEAYGGTGILHTDPTSTINKLRELGIL